MSSSLLFIYRCPPGLNAFTIKEHINAFRRYSRFDITFANSIHGLPAEIRDRKFDIIVMHYTVFGPFIDFNAAELTVEHQFLPYIQQSDAYKVAFFQDEYQFCRGRFHFINSCGINCIYTLLEPAYHEKVYGQNTRVRQIIQCIPGYVDDSICTIADRFGLDDEARTIDVGYRSRSLPYRVGKGGLEKVFIATEFKKHCSRYNLRCDIDVAEKRRIYGQGWFKFMANCRGMLGTESGTSIFDIDGTVSQFCNHALSVNPKMKFEEIAPHLAPWEDKIYYRTISPRHFEASAFRVTQILFEGRYSDILVPYRHYIPLKKDFSNIDEVMNLFQNTSYRGELTENAIQDLIRSDKYSYRSFIASFDDNLISQGFTPGKTRQKLHSGAVQQLASTVNRKLTILVVLHHKIDENMRPTLKDHLYCFERHSSHQVHYLNYAAGDKFSDFVGIHFDLIVFHTLFLSTHWSPIISRNLMTSDDFRLLRNYPAVKIGLPQDEFVHSDTLCELIDQAGINHVFSVSPPSEWPIIYNRLDLNRIRFHHVLTGYIDESRLKRHERAALWDRPIDIGYRAVPLPWLGRHGLLKQQVADVFLRHAPSYGLAIDISTRRQDNFLEEEWFRFLTRCKYFIGVEGGASVLDRDGSISARYAAIVKALPDASFEQIEDFCFPGQDGKLKLFALSPRHLEACMTRTCQILVEGDYNGVLEKGRHYIELKKDFSNIHEVLTLVRDDSLRKNIVESAYQDIVASGNYSYERFVAQVIDVALSPDSVTQNEVSSGPSSQVSGFVEQVLLRVEQGTFLKETSHDFIEAAVFELYGTAGWDVSTVFGKAAALNHLGVEAAKYRNPDKRKQEQSIALASYCIELAYRYLPDDPVIVANVMLLASILRGASSTSSFLKKELQRPVSSSSVKRIEVSSPPPRIAFFAGDGDNFHFAKPIMGYLSGQGYEVQSFPAQGLSPEHIYQILRWSSLAWFDWGNGPIVTASHLPKQCPMICRIHRYEVYQEEVKNVQWHNVDGLIFVNEVFSNVFREIVDNNIDSKTKVHIIPNPVDECLRFRERHNNYRIAYISRFQPVKNPAMMVQILHRLVKQDPRYVIYMIGGIQDYQLYQYCIKLIRDLGLESHFVYEGTTDKVQEWLDDKSFFLSTSIVESQGLGIMDAMMMGIKPVIHAGFGDLHNVYNPRYVFKVVEEAVSMIMNENYNSAEYRQCIVNRYGSSTVLPKIKKLIDSTMVITHEG